MPVTKQRVKAPPEPTEQDRLLEESLERLAIEGGKLFGEEDIVFQGTKFVLPANTNLDEAIEFLGKRRDDEQNTTRFSRTFNYRPLDGARATARAITEGSGFTLGKTTYSFFGRNPPELVEISTGPHAGDTEQVPQGAMMIPGLENTSLYLSSTTHAELGDVFHVVVEAPRKYRFHIKGLFDRIQRYLVEDSLYRGKAINGSMEFIDPFVVDPGEIIYAARVAHRLKNELWDRIRYAEAFAKAGQGSKRALLLEGPYGSGKSVAADLTAQVALDNGWTFLFCRPGKDNIGQVMQLARMYQPAVVFREDVDNMARHNAQDIEQTLDLMDGIDNKGLRLIVVMTTNHAEQIHKGMIRPGRLHGIISIGAMDPAGIELLTRRVCREALDDNIDWEAVGRSMEGYMPAFVREALDRAVGESISNNDGVLGRITTQDLTDAADSLRDQLALMEGAKDTPREDTMASAFRTVVRGALPGMTIVDSDGDYAYELAAANGG